MRPRGCPRVLAAATLSCVEGPLPSAPRFKLLAGPDCASRDHCRDRQLADGFQPVEADRPRDNLPKGRVDLRHLWRGGEAGDATLDQIVPVALGGAHTAANLDSHTPCATAVARPAHHPSCFRLGGGPKRTAELPGRRRAACEATYRVVEKLGEADQRFVVHDVVLCKDHDVIRWRPDLGECNSGARSARSRSSNPRPSTTLPATWIISVPTVIVTM